MINKTKPIVWSDKNVRNFWDYESAFYQNYFTYQVGNILVQKFSGLIKSSTYILDYGCGVGYLMKELLNKGKKVYGLDASKDSIKIVKRDFKNNKNFVSAFTNAEVGKYKGKFDLIFLVEVIEHLDNKNLKLVTNDLKQLSMKNGLIVVTTPNDEILSESVIHCPNCDSLFHRWQHLRSWNEISLKKYFEENGFESINIYSTQFGKNWIGLTDIYNFIIGKKDIKKPHLVGVFKVK